MDQLYKYIATWTHSPNTLSLDEELFQRQKYYVDKLEKVPSYVEVYILINTKQIYPL